MDRLERLVNLVAALLDAKRPVGRDELRTRVGGYATDDDAFRRNFERDKELLRQMGMPLVLEPLDPSSPEGATGYRIPRERYELPDPGLADDELAALHLAASAVELEGAWGRGAATTALWKLAASATGASEPAPSRPTAATVAVAEVPGGDQVAVLFGAVAARQRVQFRYHGTTRQVDPWRLSYRKGQWYLVGWDPGRDDSRTYRLDRFQGPPEPVGSPGAFDRPVGGPAAPPPPWQLGDEEEVVAEVLVDAAHADWATAAVGEAAVAERRPDGSAVLKMAVTNTEGFRSFVLGFLDHAEVLGPPALRQEMVAWLERMAAVPFQSAS